MNDKKNNIKIKVSYLYGHKIVSGALELMQDQIHFSPQSKNICGEFTVINRDIIRVEVFNYLGFFPIGIRLVTLLAKVEFLTMARNKIIKELS